MGGRGFSSRDRIESTRFIKILVSFLFWGGGGGHIAKSPIFENNIDHC